MTLVLIAMALYAASWLAIAVLTARPGAAPSVGAPAFDVATPEQETAARRAA